MTRFERSDTDDPKGPSRSERWLSEPTTIEVQGQGIRVFDVRPDQEKTSTPTLLVPGWAARPALFEEGILELAARGRRVIAVEAPHGVKIAAEESQSLQKTLVSLSGQENGGGIEDQELRKVVATIQALEKKNIPRVDAIAHSEGGLNIILAAALYPELFRNIVLIDPAGIIGKDAPAQLVGRFAQGSAKEFLAALRANSGVSKLGMAGRTIFSIFAKNPILSMREILAIANSDTRELLKYLREKGIRISVIHGTGDAFPSSRAAEAISAEHVEGFASVRGGHSAVYTDPRIIRAADAFLDAMARKDVGKRP